MQQFLTYGSHQYMSQNQPIYAQGMIVSLDKIKSKVTPRILSTNSLNAVVWMIVSPKIHILEF